MVSVLITPEAQRQFARLSLPIQKRVTAVFRRLRAWPEVSGVKPLSADMKGNYRIRTGDYRVLFRISKEGLVEVVLVWRIGNRRDVYGE